MYVHDDGQSLLGCTLKGKSKREMDAQGLSTSDEAST